MRQKKQESHSVVDFYNPHQKQDATPLKALTPAQDRYIKAIKSSTLTFGIGPAGTGKSYIVAALAAEALKANTLDQFIVIRPCVEAGEKLGFLPGPQPLDAKIATPYGWTTMGELKIGDYVIGGDGKPTKVIGIYPKGKKQVYKITTTDGTSTEACGDHVWLTKTFEDRKRGRKGKLKTTDEIATTLYNRTKLNHHLPRNKAVNYISNITLPLPPYTLGYLIGNGYFGSSVSVASIDKEVIDRISDELASIACFFGKKPDESILYSIRSDLEFNKSARPIRLTNTLTNEIIAEYASIGIAIKALNEKRAYIQRWCDGNKVINDIKYEFLPCDYKWTNPLREIIYNLGLEGKKSYEKFIPEIYKYISIEDRLNLLRGLMDSDGTVKKMGEASFATTSKQLAEDIIELTRSLGGRATLCIRDRIGNTSTHKEFSITSRRVSYEFTISLEEEFNPFYVTRKAERYAQKYIHGVGIVSIEPVDFKEVQCIKVDNEDSLYLTDNFIVTHNTMDEKFDPYLEPVIDILNERLGKTLVKYYQKQDRIVGKPLAYLRGKTLKNSMVIVDEAQNLTKAQMLMVLTRIGEGCKLIIDGDMAQSDIKDSGLPDAIARLEGQLNDCRIVRFTNADVVRSGIVADILALYDK